MAHRCRIHQVGARPGNGKRHIKMGAVRLRGFKCHCGPRDTMMSADKKRIEIRGISLSLKVIDGAGGRVTSRRQDTMPNGYLVDVTVVSLRSSLSPLL